MPASAPPLTVVVVHWNQPEACLESLDASDNVLTRLPAVPELQPLHKLRFLNLSHNMLTRLPRSIGALPALTQLDASRIADLSLR